MLDEVDSPAGTCAAQLRNEPGVQPGAGTVRSEGPHNIEVEQALLGALFISNLAIAKVEALLRQEHFYDPLHGEI